MTHHVLIPGIFGTVLQNATRGKIWPPVDNAGFPPISDDERVTLLLDEALQVGEIIPWASCAGQVYGPIIDALRKRGGYVPFAYDWRQDIRACADRLATLLASLDDDDIVLVAHSMGGLVARFMLECGTHAAQDWFKRVRLAVFVCTPHLGAPLVLLRILGQDEINVFISPRLTRDLANDPRYPSAYQLLPPASVHCVSPSQGADQDVFAACGSRLDPGLSRTATDLHATLDGFAIPPGLRYCLACAVTYNDTTVVGATIAADGSVAATRTTGHGDNTVPIWSADPTLHSAAAQTRIVDVQRFVADHVSVLGNPAFLTQLGTWLDRGGGVA